jgi:hypothetical protein
MKYTILILAILSMSGSVLADVETVDLAVAADESIDAPTLNIEGQYKEKEVVLKEEPKKVVEVKPRLTQSELLRRRREQLEIRNQVMVQKKMEQIRLQQEILLAKKLEQSMNQTIKAIDNSLNN